MKSEWFIWCVTKNERKAYKLLDRVCTHLSCVPENTFIQRDEDIPGYSIHFEIPSCSASWNDMIVELTHLGYHVAENWVVQPGKFGKSIYHSAEGFSDECQVTGVRRIQWHIDNEELITSNDRSE